MKNLIWVVDVFQTNVEPIVFENFSKQPFENVKDFLQKATLFEKENNIEDTFSELYTLENLCLAFNDGLISDSTMMMYQIQVTE